MGKFPMELDKERITNQQSQKIIFHKKSSQVLHAITELKLYRGVLVTTLLRFFGRFMMLDGWEPSLFK
jgi:hypothetical protein